MNNPRALRFAIAIVSTCAAALAAAGTEHFEMRVRPVLAKSCYGCHSTAPMGGLAVNSRAALLKGGQHGPAIVPGKPEESLLIKAVREPDDKLKMPMQAERLSAREIEDLEAWIKDGAAWPEAAAAPKRSSYVITPEQRAFWAFRPVSKPALPRVRNTAWAKNDVDRFVLAKLEEKGLAPNKPAAKRDLIRRAYLDLTGLPPTFEQTEAFLNDPSPGAYGQMIDRLLASEHYGERWGRYWLDVARYADDKLNNDVEDPYANSFRYRDWAIRAFNEDMPYDLFVKAQIAGDQIQDGKHKDLAVGLGLYGLGPELADDSVDVTTRGFLALTGACAQCHDHKFDPIPTKDYYAISGVFTSGRRSELELAPADVVAKYKAQEKKIKEVEDRITNFLHNQATQMAEVLASESPRYIRAARNVLGAAADSKQIAAAGGLDAETLARWVRLLSDSNLDNPHLKGWREDSFDLAKFRETALNVLKERKAVDDENFLRRGGAKKQVLQEFVAVALPLDKFQLWRDLFFNDFYGNEFKQEEDGILYYGPNRGYLKSDGTIERFFDGPWKTHLVAMRAELRVLRSDLPARYPFAHIIKDDKIRNERVQIGGQKENPGEEAPRAFLSILCDGPPEPFKNGSGRLELAEAIANSRNPLTARVMVNRIWQRHFGEGLVRTLSNFGRMGETPSHPELLDYLASRFTESGWSIKSLHREIMLSSTYMLSADVSDRNFRVDPDNRLLWRAHRRRLDAEALRDSLLFVSGELDRSAGGPSVKMDTPGMHRRTVYGFVSRRKLDPTLSLFDFPNPNASAEQRLVTLTPLQQLYFLNSGFVNGRAIALTGRLAGEAEARIRGLYKTVLGRLPAADELRMSLDYVAGNEDWANFAKILLSSNEFLFVN